MLRSQRQVVRNVKVFEDLLGNPMKDRCRDLAALMERIGLERGGDTSAEGKRS